MLNIGIIGNKNIKVTKDNTAAALGSGSLEVFATPAMITLIEATASNSVQDDLQPGCSTVGTNINICHSAPSPIGNNISCRTELIGINKRKLTFSVMVSDSTGAIGSGTHERFIVDNAKFMHKAQSRNKDI